MGEHYGCVGWEGAANTEDANHSTGRVKRPRWDRQEVWQKLDVSLHQTTEPEVQSVLSVHSSGPVHNVQIMIYIYI